MLGWSNIIAPCSVGVLESKGELTLCLAQGVPWYFSTQWKVCILRRGRRIGVSRCLRDRDATTEMVGGIEGRCWGPQATLSGAWGVSDAGK